MSLLYVRLGNVGSMLGLQYVLGQVWEETERARTAAIKGMTLLLWLACGCQVCWYIRHRRELLVWITFLARGKNYAYVLTGALLSVCAQCCRRYQRSPRKLRS
jgi:hypothetical protein